MINKTIKKVAILKLSAMGDIIHAMVALEFIKSKYPHIQIDWFVEGVFSEVLKHNPNINNIYDVNLKSIKKNKKNIFNQISIIKNYSKENYDLVIDAQGLIKSAIVSKLLGKNRAGFSKNSTREKLASMFYHKKIEIAYDRNVIERNLEVLLTPLEIEVTKEDILSKTPFLFFKNEDKSIEEFFSKDKKNIIFVIGASWPSKIYSKEKFVNIINSLNDNCLIVWGNDEEKEMALYIASKTDALVFPKINLNTLKAVISKADLVIGNDTGPTHMAWGLNVPSITLFGNTPGYRNTYTTSINKVLESDSKVNPNKLDREDFSISKIDEKDIIKMVKELI